MIERNTMQRGNDAFQFRRQALLKTTEGWDLTRETSCTGFSISTTQPADSNIRIIFEIDDKLYYFTNDGISQYRWHGELADILQNGNTVAELLAVEGIVQWVGKIIYPIIALDAPRDAEVMPKIKLGLNVNCFNDEYTRDYLSPVYELKHADNPARITAATYDKSLNGNATANSLIRLRDINGNWSDWFDYADSIGKEACAVQFKNHYVVTTLDGSDDAKIFNCNVSYITDSQNLSGNTLELVTKPQSYAHNLETCYALIKHSELIDADIKAFVKFESLPLKRKNLEIGTGIGGLKTYYLGINGGIDLGINQNTLRITADGRNILDFYYNTNNATVEIDVDSGVTICASYDYNLQNENWIEMEKISTEVYDDSGQYITRFFYRTTDTKKISAVKFSATRQTGNDTVNLGSATGKFQAALLPHRAKSESINVAGSWKYNEDTQILEITAPKDTDLTLSYDWVGVLPKVNSFAVGWLPKFYS